MHTLRWFSAAALWASIFAVAAPAAAQDKLDEVEMTDDEPEDPETGGANDLSGTEENPVDPTILGGEKKKTVTTKKKAPPPKDRSNYPQRFIERPLTLYGGMAQVSLDVPVSISSDPFYAAFNLEAQYGIVDEFQIGVRYGVGAVTDGDPSFIEGKTLALDGVYQIQDWLAAQISVPFYLDPFQIGLTLGAPMQGNIGPVRFFGGHDLIQIGLKDFFPDVENPVGNQALVDGLELNNVVPDGNVNLNFGAGYQHSDALTLLTEWRIGFTDFDTSQNLVSTFFGVQYAKGNNLDLALRLGFNDLTDASETFAAGVLARLRI